MSGQAASSQFVAPPPPSIYVHCTILPYTHYVYPSPLIRVHTYMRMHPSLYPFIIAKSGWSHDPWLLLVEYVNDLFVFHLYNSSVIGYLINYMYTLKSKLNLNYYFLNHITISYLLQPQRQTLDVLGLMARVTGTTLIYGPFQGQHSNNFKIP
jgi:hypothetical protein